MAKTAPNPILGYCCCPLKFCQYPKAEVRQGVKGRVYVVCDKCVSMISTMSVDGRDGIKAMLTEPAEPAHKVGAGDTATAAAPAPTPKHTPVPTPKKATVPSFFGLQPS